MTHTLWRRCFVVALVAWSLVLSGALEAPSAAASAFQATLSYTVDEGVYNNSVWLENVTAMSYPRIVVDRNATSPYAGTVYVLGLQGAANGTCSSPAVTRSFDGGRTFDTLHVSSRCLPGLTLDPAVGRDGTLYAAAWGPRILRSSDGGLSWTITATLGNASGPASLAVDPVTGGLLIAWTNASWPASGDVLTSSSWDGGTTWQPAVHLLSAGIQGFSPQIAAFGASEVVGLVASNTTGPFVAAVASRDGGSTWLAPTALTGVVPCARYAAPSLAVSPGGVYALSWYADPAYTGTGCWDTMGSSTETLVSLSLDGGLTFGPARHAGGPPGFPTVSFGDAVAFDDASRLYVTWHSVDANWTGTVYVANSTGPAGEFETSHFTTGLQLSGGNSTAQENLAAGTNGTVYLVWVSFNSGTAKGIYVRAITGEAAGSVDLPASLASSTVFIELRDNRSGLLGGRIPWQGSEVTVQGLTPSLYNVSVEINTWSETAGVIPVRTWGRTSFTIRVNASGQVTPPTEGGPGGPPLLLFAAAGAGIAAAGIVLASVLHTRLARETALQREVRRLMFGFIRDHPGASFSEVRHALGLENGVAAYHLGVLEKLGLVHSESRRRHRWYYPNGDVSLWRELPLSPLQASIVQAVRQEPGIGVRELARRVDHRVSSVDYSVKALSRDGVLRTDRVNRKLCCFPGDGQPTS